MGQDGVRGTAVAAEQGLGKASTKCRPFTSTSIHSRLCSHPPTHPFVSHFNQMTAFRCSGLTQMPPPLSLLYLSLTQMSAFSP